MTVIIFLIILAVLVFVHELGHFLIAKASGIRVDEFGLGFPPKIFSFKKGETLYSLNAIPFGGFVKIFGEDPNDESISGPDSERSFVNKRKSIQAAVLVAGITFNIIFAWILISIGFMTGMPVPYDYSSSGTVANQQLTVTGIVKDSPAEKAGLKSGDALISLQYGQDYQEKMSVTDMQNFIAGHANKPVTLNYSRGSTPGVTTITPVATNGDKATIGINIDVLGTLKLSLFPAFVEGAKLTGYIIKATAVGLALFIWQAITGHAQFGDVTGPVGIAGLVGDATRLGFVYLLSFTAFISINLAVINLIPFPALDGGRLLFVLIEKIKGSPIKPAIANMFNLVGFSLLILLMLVVTFHDILKLFIK
jgi:regulator of sigma E protease